MDALTFLGLALAACAGVALDRWVLRPVTKCDLEAAKDEIIVALRGSLVTYPTQRAVERLQKALNKLDAQVMDN